MPLNRALPVPFSFSSFFLFPENPYPRLFIPQTPGSAPRIREGRIFPSQ